MSSNPIKTCDELLGYCQVVIIGNQLREIKVNRKGYKKLTFDIKWDIVGAAARNVKWTQMGFCESFGTKHKLSEYIFKTK